LIQKAAYGPKSPEAYAIDNPLELPLGRGIVGSAGAERKPIVVHDTQSDNRYLVDDMPRRSEIAVPIVHEGRLIGVIDSEHPRKRHFRRWHLRALQAVARVAGPKISHAMATEAMQESERELMKLNVKMAESRFQNLRLQMNPHFLFNSLSSIQHLIVSQQTNRAYRYLTIFSNFLRTLLKYADKNFVPLDEELKILKMYIELESLRFDDSFHYRIHIDDGLENDNILLPTLMIQPFVENAIWHGLLHKEGEKQLEIHFSGEEEEILTCVISDNGIGRDAAARIKSASISANMHESRGIDIIRERLELLERKTGQPARVEFDDKPGGGTRVTIHIPYYNQEEL
jgi:LytS/YehU family sensor histidine kinase